MRLALLLPLAVSLAHAAVSVDLSQLQPGPIRATADGETLTVEWPDEAERTWRARFSLDPEKPLLASLGPAEAAIVEQAQPWHQVEVGKRRGGWNAFFDYPPSHPEGTRVFQPEFQLSAARVRSRGERLEVDFDGLRIGPFAGRLVYTFFPGSRLVQQEAVVSTDEPDVAYYYDAGLEFSGEADATAGRNMRTRFAWYDVEGELVHHEENGFQPERTPERVRYRTLAARTAAGALAVFPAPHQYFFPRDFTSNLGYLWRRAWRGRVGLGVRQIRDTNWRFYPWVNAPPGSEQRLSLFLWFTDGAPEEALDEVRRFTHSDRFPRLDGYQAMSSHWHLAYTVQAVVNGKQWVPPFKPVLEAMGVDASMIMDFHGDGHPRDLTELRLEELEAFYDACRRLSGDDFLLIPAEEANVHYGGHWAVAFPKPVYWFMNRPPGGAFEIEHPRLGKVYSVADETEMLDLIRRENGLAYQTHPRTKGSTGFPDKISESAQFQDPTFFGAGWKAMPADLSRPRLGDRSLDLLDDMNNWGAKKRLIGEVDVFQFDHTHELYAHMNMNYVRADRLPSFDDYGELLERLEQGDFFVTTGEVLLPEIEISGEDDRIEVRTTVEWTFPLNFAEIVWGDGEKTERKVIPLDQTRSFGRNSFEWSASTPGWKWARVAVWDVAANGAFVNPTWRE